MKFYESEYEEALISLLTEVGWSYIHGTKLTRPLREVLLEEELDSFLRQHYPALGEEDRAAIISHLRHVGGQSHFDQLRRTYQLLRDGYRYLRASDGQPFDIQYIDYVHPEANSFRVVNQYAVGYGQGADVRIPDILLFVNGIPLCLFELKNPTDATATIADAYAQIHTRYLRDIPHLLRYCLLTCISDATKNNTKLGTTYTPYEHYYAWKKVRNEDPAATAGVDQVRTIIGGVYAPARFLEILRDYIYFPDAKSAREEEIVCRYPQFFATRMLRDHILEAYARGDRRGGTYFGATGCGKTYTMMFLARQLSLRCPQLESPTIVMLVDREDLQTQAGKLFLRSEEFLSLGTAKIIDSRAELQAELGLRTSGGFFICTIQKFCEATGLINPRRNIICFSDEAHRSQVTLGRQLRIRDERTPRALPATEAEATPPTEELGAFITKPYAELLRTAFPQATFVGFTGTPIDETIQVFGQIVDSYTMRQAVEDGITRDIKYIPRIARVTLDSERVREIDAYYQQCAQEGATEEDIQKSKQAMSAMEIILGDEDRLERLAADIIAHYSQACDNRPDVVQKAMIVSSKRQIAYRLLKKFEQLRPDWFELRKSPDDSQLSAEELRALVPMPTIAMVATRSANDPAEMYHYLGDRKRAQQLDDAFKQERSNFRLVIVVDMWITGFDVPCLTYLYNDKPLQKQTLIQTISRVNRNYAGKEYGYVIDYIGIHRPMMEAMRQFGGEEFGPSQDDVAQALEVVRIELETLRPIFTGFDLTPFTSPEVAPIVRLECLSAAAEHILTRSEQLHLVRGLSAPQPVDVRTFFLHHVKRLRSAYDICQPSDVLSLEELSLAQCYMAVASYIRKTSGERHDVESMNRAVERLVQEALSCSSVVSILETEVEEELFSPAFVSQLEHIRLPATRLEVLVKLLRKSIQAYKQTNKVSAEKYEELLRKTLEAYHQRREALSSAEVTATQQEAVSAIIDEAEQQALELLEQLGVDKESFRTLGLTFEEKAFYDILIHLRDKYNFAYGEDRQVGGMVINDKCRQLARKIKEEIDIQSSYSDWLNNANVRAELNQKLFFCLYNSGYPPEYNEEVFSQVMEQVEHFQAHHSS